MKHLLLIFAFSFSLLSEDLGLLKEGDIIFQETDSEQSRAIRIATKSRYTHVGILFKKEDDWVVYEAIQPVKVTNLSEFISRGVNRHYVIKRIKNYNSIINISNIRDLEKEGKKYLGKDYDIYFEWTDNKIYCSELVWKMYKSVFNLEIGKLAKLKEFNLTHPFVKKIMKKRYKDKIPLDETVISPESMFQSEELKTILEEN